MLLKGLYLIGECMFSTSVDKYYNLCGNTWGIFLCILILLCIYSIIFIFIIKQSRIWIYISTQILRLLSPPALNIDQPNFRRHLRQVDIRLIRENIRLGYMLGHRLRNHIDND